jgi:hypothetical protein
MLKLFGCAVTCVMLSSFGHSAVILDSFTAIYGGDLGGINELQMDFGGAAYVDGTYNINGIANPTAFDDVRLIGTGNPPGFLEPFTVETFGISFTVAGNVATVNGWEATGTDSRPIGWNADDVALTTFDQGPLGTLRDSQFLFHPAEVPLPAAGWLFISALAGLAGKKRLSRQNVG